MKRSTERVMCAGRGMRNASARMSGHGRVAILTITTVLSRAQGSVTAPVDPSPFGLQTSSDGDGGVPSRVALRRSRVSAHVVDDETPDKMIRVTPRDSPAAPRG